MKILFDEPLAKHSYYKIGGPAKVLAFPESESDLFELRKSYQNQMPMITIGAGSNILFSDDGFDGLVIKMSAYNPNQFNLGPSGLNARIWRASCAVTVVSLLRETCEQGLKGLVCIAGVPGNVGGAVAMNAGTHLGEIQKWVRKVRAFNWETGVTEEVDRESCGFIYRSSDFLTDSRIILDVEFELTQADPLDIKAEIDDVLKRRKQTQPLEFPSCGSVFKNPERTTLKAWQVVERLGLRGYQIGGAQYSEKHPNWIVNRGGAKAADVVELIQIAKKRAHDELGISLQEEVKIIHPHTKSP